MCESWGYFRLGAFYRKESIEEMVHAEKLMDRILFLDGTPNMTDIGPIKVGTNVKAQFESDLALEMHAVKQLNDAIRVASEVGDNASRTLFEVESLLPLPRARPWNNCDYDHSWQCQYS